MRILHTEYCLPIQTNKDDDLLILANSFEKRCLSFAQKTAMQKTPFKAKSVILFTYSDRGDSFVKQKCKINYKDLLTYAKIISTSDVTVLSFEPYEIWSTIKMYKNIFASIPNDSSVTIDISTIPKIHLFYLLEEAHNSKRVNKLRLAYTRARYGKYDALSWGAEEPFALPLFGQPRLSNQDKSHLVLFCGLEPERSYSVWRHYGQDRCTKIFIDSGEDDFDRPTSRAMRYNNFDERETPLILPAFDNTDKIINQINAIYCQCKLKNEYLFISPFTTKWEACAIWEFFHRHSNRVEASIIYCAPGRFNTSGYTVDETGDLLFAEMK